MFQTMPAFGTTSQASATFLNVTVNNSDPAMAQLNQPKALKVDLPKDTVMFSGVASNDEKDALAEMTKTLAATLVDCIVEHLRVMVVDSDDYEMDVDYMPLFEDQKALAKFKELSVERLLEGDVPSIEQLNDSIVYFSQSTDDPNLDLAVLVAIEGFKFNYIIQEIMAAV